MTPSISIISKQYALADTILAKTGQSVARVVPNPLGFDSEEDPDPTTKDFQKLNNEYRALKVNNMVQVRTELETPRAPEHQIKDNDTVVSGWRANIEASAKTKRMIQSIPLLRRREQRQVPILGHIPVEGVQAVDHASTNPGPVQGGRRAPAALESREDDDGECGAVLERVGEVLPAPARLLVHPAPAHSAVLNQTLAQPDHTRYRHDERHHDGAAAVAVRARGGRAVGLEEHAQGDVQVAKDLSVRREHIGQQNVAELAVLGFCNPADADPFERAAESLAALRR